MPITDLCLITLALYGAYLIRFDFEIWPQYESQFLRFLPIVVLVRLAALYYSRSYSFLWRYTGLNELVSLAMGVGLGLVALAGVNYFRNYVVACVLAGGFLASALLHRVLSRWWQRRTVRRATLVVVGLLACAVLGGAIGAFMLISSAPANLATLGWGRSVIQADLQPVQGVPRGVQLLEAILSLLLLSTARITPRLVSEYRGKRRNEGRRSLIYGAGDVGESLIRILRRYPRAGVVPVGFVDDDTSKLGVAIHGIPVLGTRADLGVLVERHSVQDVLLAVTALESRAMREVVHTCWERSVKVRRVPDPALLVTRPAGIEQFEEITIQDLLGRPEIEFDGEGLAYLRGKTVLVTGAGGSIGSEICRQVSACSVGRVVLVGRGENSIYHIAEELAADNPAVEVSSVIADAGDEGKMERVLEDHAPEVVFHTSAYKHVPFMEQYPEEAVRNNVVGTQRLVAAAIRHGVPKFINISSDKAVYPKSVMGATKRVAELIVANAGASSDTEFVTVRFGNVLRSRGSVIPLFERQILAGGPVTVTHPEMTRYFMSIPEAVRLVLHSGGLADGRLCVLDMGAPVRIAELAENMIRLAGKRPHEDIEIAYTGVRPGEKLRERLFTEKEARTIRREGKILVCEPEIFEKRVLEMMLLELEEAARRCDRERVLELLGEVGYNPVPVVDDCKESESDDTRDRA